MPGRSRTLIRSRVQSGRPYPLGAHWDGLGVNFALYSRHATAVELCLFDARGRESERVALPEYTDEVWHGYLPDARPGQRYGYRVHGAYSPEDGHRFNPNKLLLDPYARQISGSLRWAPHLFGYIQGHRDADRSFDRRDSAAYMPRCVVIDPAYTWGADARPRVAWEHTVIYEAHVRGLTMQHPLVPGSERGTFAGLGNDAVLEHLRRLGVTTVELLPVQAFVDDQHLLQKGLRNYWGYNSIGYFAPDPRYLEDGSVDEFKQMVARLHHAGLEVVLDVVYNHTAEGNELGPTLSFKGIDNASYYRLAENKRYYVNDTGTGNTLDLTHAGVLRLVMDSLRYWVSDMHVDGFRFDLASILARERLGFDPSGSFLDAVRQDPVLGQVKLIAEPWDIGPGGYQLGNFAPGWSEWNDRFRDTMRALWRGDADQLADFATRFTGSADLFEHNGRRPSSSINFITAHDGFTLRDLVSYAGKHNEANGEDNRDGSSHNLSSNHGVEGHTDDPVIVAARLQHMRNLLATLLLSQGTPMLLAGDEFGHSQQGNNNAYCQDNPLSWLDWALAAGGEAQSLARFVETLVELRRRHPLLRRNRFLRGKPDAQSQVIDVRWYRPDGALMEQGDWHDGQRRSLAIVLDGRGPDNGLREPGNHVSLALLLNAGGVEETFVLAEASVRFDTLLLQTASEPVQRLPGGQWQVPAQSLCLLAAT